METAGNEECNILSGQNGQLSAQTVLPDRSILVRQKVVENVKNQIFKFENQKGQF